MEKLNQIMERFVISGWDLIAVPARNWLAGKRNVPAMIAAIQQAEAECGGCGCEMDSLYPQALALLNQIGALEDGKI